MRPVSVAPLLLLLCLAPRATPAQDLCPLEDALRSPSRHVVVELLGAEATERIVLDQIVLELAQHDPEAAATLTRAHGGTLADTLAARVCAEMSHDELAAAVAALDSEGGRAIVRLLRTARRTEVPAIEAWRRQVSVPPPVD